MAALLAEGLVDGVEVERSGQCGMLGVLRMSREVSDTPEQAVPTTPIPVCSAIVLESGNQLGGSIYTTEVDNCCIMQSSASTTIPCLNQRVAFPRGIFLERSGLIGSKKQGMARLGNCKMEPPAQSEKREEGHLVHLSKKAFCLAGLLFPKQVALVRKNQRAGSTSKIRIYL